MNSLCTFRVTVSSYGTHAMSKIKVIIFIATCFFVFCHRDQLTAYLSFKFSKRTKNFHLQLC